jgi:hypothetical protein
MPLVPGKSRAALEKNIAIERKAGKPEKQAVAIAYSKRGEDAFKITSAQRPAFEWACNFANASEEGAYMFAGFYQNYVKKFPGATKAQAWKAQTSMLQNGGQAPAYSKRGEDAFKITSAQRPAFEWACNFANASEEGAYMFAGFYQNYVKKFPGATKAQAWKAQTSMLQNGGQAPAPAKDSDLEPIPVKGEGKDVDIDEAEYTAKRAAGKALAAYESARRSKSSTPEREAKLRNKYEELQSAYYAARKAAKAKDDSLEPIPTPAEKKLALAKHATGITKSQDNDGPFYKGEAAKRSSGETGTVVEQKGGRVIVVPDRLKSTTESWEVGKTSLLHKATDKWSSAEEQKYFDLRKKHQAKLEAKNPGESSNRLRAHESAMKEMGEKVVPYALGKGDDLKKLRDARAKALDMEPIPVPGKDADNAWCPTCSGAGERTKGSTCVTCAGSGRVKIEPAGTPKKKPAKDSEVPIGFAAGKSPEFRQAEWERRRAELREANAREHAERQKKKAKDAGPERLEIVGTAKGESIWKVKTAGGEIRYMPHLSGGLYPSVTAAKEAVEGKAKDSAQISGSEPQDHLARANQYEIAGDRARALDSYRAAATGYRRLGNHQGEDSARDGIVECQRRLVGGHEGLYDHPSKGKHQAFDSADRALTSALQRTRAGESVRITDSGFEVIPAGTKRAKDGAASTAWASLPFAAQEKILIANGITAGQAHNWAGESWMKLPDHIRGAFLKHFHSEAK